MPVALLVGGGCGLIAVIGVVILLIAVVAGAAAASDDAVEVEPTKVNVPKVPAKEDLGDVMDGASYARVRATRVEVPVPPGWQQDRKGLYSFAISGDKKAMLAFTTVSSIGEFNGRMQHATRTFRIEDCNMQPATRVRLGPNRLRARLREGKCSFNGVPASVATVLVETGRRRHPLVIYAVDVAASKRTTEQAQQTILRMRLQL